MPLNDYQEIIADVERHAREVWDFRDERNRLRDLVEHESKFLEDVRSVTDRHNAYCGSALKQYGIDSDQYRAIKDSSDRQKAREMLAALDAYKTACEEVR